MLNEPFIRPYIYGIPHVINQYINLFLLSIIKSQYLANIIHEININICFVIFFFSTRCMSFLSLLHLIF